MQRGPVGQAAREHGVASLYLRVEARERREQRLAQHSADANLAAGRGRRILHDLTIAGARVTAYHTNGVTTVRTVRRDAEKMKFALALALVLAAAIATLGGAHRTSAEGVSSTGRCTAAGLQVRTAPCPSSDQTYSAGAAAR